MAFATAHPNEYLVIGQGGKVINRGTGIRVFLWPGSTYVLIPSTKQEALFEMTQETKDGIPLHFKGIVIYRISDPAVAAMSFNFSNDTGIEEINSLINNICRGELRATVSGMSMNECIEQRKTILTAAVDRALRETVFSTSSGNGAGWGIELELAQVAQVYIIDNALRKQLEAEVRNEIRSKSDQSDIHTQEEIKLAQIASDRQIQEQRQVVEKDAIRQKEEIELANLQARRRMQKQKQELDNEAINLGVETFKLNEEANREKAETETPVRLMQLDKQQQIRERELELRKIENQVRELEVYRDMIFDKARQELRKEILPVEQVPAIAASLSNVFKDAHLTFLGSENQLFSSLLPLMTIVSEALKGANASTAGVKPGGD
jgi:hypothetical protein